MPTLLALEGDAAPHTRLKRESFAPACLSASAAAEAREAMTQSHTSNAARFHSALLRSELSYSLRYCTRARDGNAAPLHSLALLPSELAQSLFHTLSMRLASPSLLFASLRVASHRSGPRLPRSDDTACLPPVRVPCRLPSLASLRHRHRHRHRLCQCLSLTLCLSFFLSSLLFSSL